jgi:hypothetical protein
MLKKKPGLVVVTRVVTLAARVDEESGIDPPTVRFH